MKGKKITQKQIDYVLSHFRDCTRKKLAKDAGMSMASLYLILGRYRLNSDKEKEKKEKEEQQLRKLFPNHESKEIAHILGITASAVRKRAKRLNLKRSDEFIKKGKAKKRETLASNVRKSDKKKRVRTWKLHRRMDEIRFMSGMPQKTKFRMKVYPKKTYTAMYYLCRTYGYEFSDSDYFELIRPEPYNKERFAKVEEYHSNKYKIKFK